MREEKWYGVWLMMFRKVGGVDLMSLDEKDEEFGVRKVKVSKFLALGKIWQSFFTFGSEWNEIRVEGLYRLRNRDVIWKNRVAMLVL